MDQRPLIVMSLGSAMRLVLITGLVIALAILAISGSGPAAQSTVHAPTPSAPAQPHG